MCGLVGVAGSIYKKEFDAFLTMLAVDTVRGEHSTGVGYVKRDKQMGYYKNSEPGWSFVSDPRLLKRIEDFNNRVLIGHNRWATRGKINAANAHPFLQGNILGAHNGTLSNPEALSEGKTYEVDSQALIHEIDACGLSGSIKKVRGAWALTYYNQENHTINFLRNKERPLWIAISEDEKTIWWASEPWMFEAGPLRQGLKLKEMAEIPVDTWIRWEVPEAAAAFGKPFRRGGIVGAAYPQTNYWDKDAQARWRRQYFGGDWGDEDDGTVVVGTPSPSKAGGDVKEQVEEVASNVLRLEPPEKASRLKLGPNGVKLTDEEYDKIVETGCHFCEDGSLFQNERPRFFRGFVDTGIKDSDEWCCPDCVTGVDSVEDLEDYDTIREFSSLYGDGLKDGLNRTIN
jgi:hypothetical protein